MRIVRGSASLEKPPVRAVVTIGNFDGLHLGHISILRTVVERARILRGESVVYTFDPHPRKVLQPDRAPGLLTTLEQKVELLAEQGIDLLVLEAFSAAFAATPPDRFVRSYLHERIRPREVYVGYDFHFGKDREGSMRQLTEMGPRLGFSVTIIPEVTVGERDVNSTRIRALLADGVVEEAARLLGRPYPIRGTVVAGDRRGRTLGFPTANLETENEVMPAPGVYAGRVRMLEKSAGEAATSAAMPHPAVVNLGRRPTFGSGNAIVPEAHLLDWEGDLYGRRVELAFVARLREERRFPDAEALRRQIGCDAAEARRVLAPS